MAYNYEFKYPRKKLHEIVSRYLAQMHTMGRAPNCGVFFSALALARPDVQGWLLVSDETADAAGSYVLLEDGDVWLEGELTHEGQDAQRGWLDAPTDDLAVLLAQSLKSARMGGDGLLATGESVPSEIVVEDRRRTMQSFAGREKRSW